MVKVPFKRLLLSVSMVLTSMVASSPSALAAGPVPNDPNFVNCVFASSAYWTQCWVPPNYSPLYTQSEIRQVEIHNNNYGWHTHWHLQPAGQETTDYFNFHIYFLGTGFLQTDPQTPAFVWRVYCSGTPGYGMCDQYAWNGPNNYGKIMDQPMSACLDSNKWNCASFAAADLKDCVTNTCPMGSWVSSNFPGIGSSVMVPDAYGHSGSLQQAFCDVIQANQNFACHHP